MRVLFLVGLVVLSGCNLLRPTYYEGTCVNAGGKEVKRVVYPPPRLETSSPAPPPCDARSPRVAVTKDDQ